MGNNNWVRQYAMCAFIVLLIYVIMNIVGYSASNQQKHFAQVVLELAYKAKRVTGLPASIVAAQCILESGWGKYDIANNYFGIKSDGTRPYVEVWTYEWENGKYVKRLCKFRKYDNLLESLIDYGNFIYQNPRYRQAIANKDNPVDYIYEIQYAGYATSPNYAEKVLAIAEQCGFLTIRKWRKVNLTKSLFSCIIREIEKKGEEDLD